MRRLLQLNRNRIIHRRQIMVEVHDQADRHPVDRHQAVPHQADHHQAAALHRAADEQGSDNMTHRSMTVTVVLMALSLGALAGCYTKLMPFKDAVRTRQASVSQNHPGNFTTDLNYRENCLSCHSEAELNDRAADMDYAGIHSVHGATYDPYGWQNPYTQPPWWEPNMPILIIGTSNGPVVSTQKPVTGTKTTAPPSNAASRRRETGSTRGTDRTREATTATSTPAPTTTTTPAAPTTTTGPTVSTPAPQTTQTPAAAPATRSSGSDDSRPRKTGSGR
jgi:hypothetical protein